MDISSALKELEGWREEFAELMRIVFAMMEGNEGDIHEKAMRVVLAGF